MFRPYLPKMGSSWKFTLLLASVLICIDTVTSLEDGCMLFTTDGQKCHFPFVFTGQQRYECVSYGTDKVCAVDAAGTSFGTCEPDSEICTQATTCPSITWHRVSGSTNGTCVFPFTYRNETFSTCIASYKGAPFYPWCSTTDNFDRDGLWANCFVLTTHGYPCSFPFKYKGIEYYRAITTDNNGQYWCMTNAATGDWGNIPPSGVNFCGHLRPPPPKKPSCGVRGFDKHLNNMGMCKFPFEYKGVNYSMCTDVDSDVIWCSFEEQLSDTSKNWGYCFNYTEGNDPCYLPFLYGATKYYAPTMVGHTKYWCGLVPDLDADEDRWDNLDLSPVIDCDDYVETTKSVTTTVATTTAATPCEVPVVHENGTTLPVSCVFPFSYKNKNYSECTFKDAWATKTDPSGASYAAAWCGTKQDVTSPADDGGLCDLAAFSACEYLLRPSCPAAACVFPFYYNGQAYYNCTRVDEKDDKPWCATTTFYTGNQQYTTCTEGACPTPPATTDVQTTAEPGSAPWCLVGTKPTPFAAINNAIPCKFPFQYQNKVYSTCIKSPTDQLDFCMTDTGQLRYCDLAALDACEKSVGSASYCPVFTSATASGPVDMSDLCQFPFTEGGKSYEICRSSPGEMTCKNAGGQTRYCDATALLACEARRNAGKYCTAVTTSGAAATCVFPSTYNGFTLYACTILDEDTYRPWCPTTADYNANQNDWAFCIECQSTTGSTSTAPPTTVATTCTGGACSTTAPTTTAQTTAAPAPWCLVGTKLTPFAAIDNTVPCKFPFQYQGKMYSTCIKRPNDPLDFCLTNGDQLRYCDLAALDACEKSVGSASYCPVFTSATAPGPVDMSDLCQFPFTDGGKSYETCRSSPGEMTCKNAGGQTRYCDATALMACEARRNAGKYCTAETNAGAAATCVFPSTYHGFTLYACTLLDEDTYRPWCPTTADYDADGAWAFCIECQSTTQSTTTAPPTTAAVTHGNCTVSTHNGDGNFGSTLCAFPFIYNGASYMSCILGDGSDVWTDGSGNPYFWCSLTNNYDTANPKRRGVCNMAEYRQCEEARRPSSECTVNLGNSGDNCVIPYTYNGQIFYNCTQTDDVYWWCGTKADGSKSEACTEFCIGDANGNGMCEEAVTQGTDTGQPCSFPFKYDNVDYTECTTVDDTRPWCSTEPTYSPNEKWGYCDCKTKPN